MTKRRNGWGAVLGALLLAHGPVAAQAPDSAAAADSLRARVAPAGPLRLEVDLSERALFVYQGDEVVKQYPVAVGKAAHPTPKGSFTIRRVIWNPKWVPPDAKWAKGKQARAPGDPKNPMGRVKMFFLPPDYYIHGTHDEDSLGQAESHGCIRLRNPDVIELAQLVMNHGGERREPGWFQRVINRVRSTQDVRLSEPVRVVIRS